MFFFSKCSWFIVSIIVSWVALFPLSLKEHTHLFYSLFNDVHSSVCCFHLWRPSLDTGICYVNTHISQSSMHLWTMKPSAWLSGCSNFPVSFSRFLRTLSVLKVPFVSCWYAINLYLNILNQRVWWGGGRFKPVFSVCHPN